MDVSESSKSLTSGASHGGSLEAAIETALLVLSYLRTYLIGNRSSPAIELPKAAPRAGVPAVVKQGIG